MTAPTTPPYPSPFYLSCASLCPLNQPAALPHTTAPTLVGGTHLLPLPHACFYAAHLRAAWMLPGAAYRLLPLPPACHYCHRTCEQSCSWRREEGRVWCVLGQTPDAGEGRAGMSGDVCAQLCVSDLPPRPLTCGLAGGRSYSEHGWQHGHFAWRRVHSGRLPGPCQWFRHSPCCGLASGYTKAWGLTGAHSPVADTLPHAIPCHLYQAGALPGMPARTGLVTWSIL